MEGRVTYNPGQISIDSKVGKVSIDPLVWKFIFNAISCHCTMRGTNLRCYTKTGFSTPRSPQDHRDWYQLLHNWIPHPRHLFARWSFVGPRGTSWQHGVNRDTLEGYGVTIHMYSLLVCKWIKGHLNTQGYDHAKHLANVGLTNMSITRWDALLQLWCMLTYRVDDMGATTYV